MAQARDRWAITSLQYRELGTLQFAERRRLVRRLASVNADVFCAHKHAEMAEMVTAMLAIPAATPGCVVEAGCFKGGSTVKLSVVAKLVGRRLVVFDSFEGLPKHGEDHGRTIFGEQTGFVPGLYAGALEEVTDNVRRFGEIDVCEFRKGWFDDTMPKFSEPIARLPTSNRKPISLRRRGRASSSSILCSSRAGLSSRTTVTFHFAWRSSATRRCGGRSAVRRPCSADSAHASSFPS